MGDRLVELGFREGSPNVHPGQGTRNRRFFFDNAMLELIWVENPDEAGSSLIAPTRLWERSRASETGASPFGLCLRQTRADEPLPFATWPYQPPYLPPGLAIPIAADTTANEPLLFVNPVGARPDRFPVDRREPLDHSAGVREISCVTITIAGDASLSRAFQTVERLGLVRIKRADEPLLELTFDDALSPPCDLRPSLPLLFVN